MSGLRSFWHFLSKDLRQGGSPDAKSYFALMAALLLVHLSVLEPLSRCIHCDSSCPMNHLHQGIAPGSPEEGSICQMGHTLDHGENPAPSCHLAMGCPGSEKKAMSSLEDLPFLGRPGWSLILPRLGAFVHLDSRHFVPGFILSPLIPPG